MPRTVEPFAPDLMQEIRARFHHVDYCPVIKAPRIFFENGGGSLKLKEALAAGAEVEALPDQEGRDNDASRYLSQILDKGREDTHLFFGSTELGDKCGQVISGETGTRLLYRLIRSVALSAPPGPIISCTLEHPASLDSAKQWAANTGREWREVPFDTATGAFSPDHYAAAVTQDTRIATVIHTSQLTGFSVDLAAVSRAVRAVAPDCYIIVDGIQHAPHGTVRVAEYGVDAYVFSPYKAFTRLSLGFAWINERMIAVPHEHMLGKSADVWELGSRDPAFYATQSKVIDYFCWIGKHFTNSGERSAQLSAGTAAMERQEAALIDLLLNGDGSTKGLLAVDGVAVIGRPSLEGREGIVSFNLKGISAPDLVQRFAARGIRVHARMSDAYSGHILAALGLPDCLRVSMCHYNTLDEVRRFLSELEDIAAEVS